MKEIKLEIHVRSLNYGELNETDRRLTDAAREATSRSYSPYSHFAVGYTVTGKRNNRYRK